MSDRILPFFDPLSTGVTYRQMDTQTNSRHNKKAQGFLFLTLRTEFGIHIIRESGEFENQKYGGCRTIQF